MKRISFAVALILSLNLGPTPAHAEDCLYGSALDINVMTQVQTITCLPAPTAEDLARREQDLQFQQQLQTLQQEAQAKSQEYNAAHPGEQKCFSYELTHPNGVSQAGGGVCANVVEAPAPVVAPPTVQPSTTTVARVKAAIKTKLTKKKAKIGTKRRAK